VLFTSDEKWFDSMQRQQICHFQTNAGAHPASDLLVPGDFSLVVKRPGHEAESTPPSSAKVKNEWSYTSPSWHAEEQLYLPLQDNTARIGGRCR